MTKGWENLHRSWDGQDFYRGTLGSKDISDRRADQQIRRQREINVLFMSKFNTHFFFQRQFFLKIQFNSILIDRKSPPSLCKSFKFLVHLFFIYLFIFGCVGLRFCARAFSSCGKRGPLFIAVRGPLTIAASLVAEHRLQTCRLSNCGSRAQLLCGMWDLPRPGLEPVSPALAGRFSTTAPPGKPPIF